MIPLRIVLPCTTPIERNDFAHGLGDAHILAMQRAVAPLHEARDDCAIFSAVADRLGFGAAFTEGRTADAWVRHLYDVTRASARESGVTLPTFDEFWEAGRVALPDPAPGQTTLARLRRDPEGAALATPSGRVEIFSESRH